MIFVLANSVYNYFRDYDPSTGRYAQSDPIGMSGGINSYSYTTGSPINYSDPYGLRKNLLPPIVETIIENSMDPVMQWQRERELKRMEKIMDLQRQLGIIDDLIDAAQITRVNCDRGCMESRESNPCFNFDQCWSGCGDDYNSDVRALNKQGDVFRRRLNGL